MLEVYMILVMLHPGTEDERVLRILPRLYYNENDAYNACIEYEESDECDYGCESATYKKIKIYGR
jgi:hypothetical protein